MGNLPLRMTFQDPRRASTLNLKRSPPPATSLPVALLAEACLAPQFVRNYGGNAGTVDPAKNLPACCNTSEVAVAPACLFR